MGRINIERIGYRKGIYGEKEVREVKIGSKYERCLRE